MELNREIKEQSEEKVENEDKEMKVIINNKYNKEYINDKIIVNGIFELGEKIGKGSYWKVYKVKRNLLSKKGEILDDNYYTFKKGVLNKKIYDMNLIGSEARIGVKEYNILKHINHPNIARLYECIIDYQKNKIVFVMEYCNIGPIMKIETNDKGEQFYNYNNTFMSFIWKLIKPNETIPLSFDYNNNKEQKYFFESASLIIIYQLCKALQYLHNQNYIAHLDIKPDNILAKSPIDSNNSIDSSIDKNNFIKLSDFSVSLKLTNNKDTISSVVGTPAFLPPEIESDDDSYNPFKVDIFALGLSIFTFLFKSFDISKFEDNINSINSHKLQNALSICLNPNPNLRCDITSLINILK